MAVYLLQHLIEREGGDEVKVIGIYSSAALADSAALEFSSIPELVIFRRVSPSTLTS